MLLNHMRALIVLPTQVKKIHSENFTRTSMPRVRHNDREQAVGMVQAGMALQAAAYHFNVAKITISRLMIRLRKQVRRMTDTFTTSRQIFTPYSPPEP